MSTAARHSRKWNWKDGKEVTICETQSRGRARGLNLVVDLIDDRREELLMAAPDVKSLRLFATWIPTLHRIQTLMHDLPGWLAIARQNVSYNKLANPSLFRGHGMRGQ